MAVLLWLMIYCIAHSKNQYRTEFDGTTRVIVASCNAITFQLRVFNPSSILEKEQNHYHQIFENKLLCHRNDLVSFIFRFSFNQVEHLF